MVEHGFKPGDRIKIKSNETTRMMCLDGKEGVVVQIEKNQILVDVTEAGLFWFWPDEIEKMEDD